MDAPSRPGYSSMSEALALRLLLCWQASDFESFRATLAEVNDTRCSFGTVVQLVWETLSIADEGWERRTQDRLRDLLDAEEHS